MILVDPACRGRGLGTRVFDEVLARLLEARDRDELETIGLDATPAGRGLYAKRGFVEGPALVRMRREPGLQGAAGRGRDEATRRMTPADVGAILDLDRTVFGADREAVLRDALASAPALARVAVDGHRVRGYCLGRHGDHSDHVGPVVADGPDLALSLVGAALASAGRRAAIVDARAEPAWTGALGALGFRAQRPLTRMYLGDVRPASTPALELAVRGPEMG
jgi:ribosomal protein S18 acetylase RimI-like enzyme